MKQLVVEFFDGHNLLSNRFLVLLVWFISFVITPAKYGAPLEALAFVLVFILLSIWLPVWTNLACTLAWIGRHSYFIFLIHFLVLRAISDFLPISNLASNGGGSLEYVGLSVLVAAAVFLVSSVGASLSMRYFERPLNDLGRQGRA